ncbi:cytochrome P450 [Astrocystis sublimbata]|nr:cytochrome P450 [Astrocystis sublimbata]
MVTIIAAVCFGVLVGWSGLMIHRIYVHPLRRCPGPKLAVVANSSWEFYWNYYRNGELIFEIERLHRLHGPVIRVGPNALHVSDPGVFQDITRASSSFAKDADFYQAISIPGTLIGETDPARHRLRRKMLNPAFTGSRVQELAPDVLEKTEQLMARFEEAFNRSVPICINAAVKAFTMDIISQIVLGTDLECVTDPNFDNEFNHYLEAAFKIGWTATAFPIISALAMKVVSYTTLSIFPLPIIALKRVSTCLNSLLNSRIGTYLLTFSLMQNCLRMTHQYLRRSNEDYSASSVPSSRRSPVIDRLIDASAMDGSNPLNLEELNDELVMLLIAGNDTTSHALIFGIYKICSIPAVRERLTRELRDEFPSITDKITYDRARSLTYLTAVIKEILRLGNPLPGRLPRTVPAAGYSLHGHLLEPGVSIHTSAYILNRQPEIWTEPNKFNPDRWIGPDASRLDKHLATFYKGSRQCLGKELAWCELWVLLANLFRRYRIEPYNTTNYDMEWKDLILVYYRNKFFAKVEKVLE